MFDRYRRVTGVMQSVVKDWEGKKPQDGFKQSYHAALSWLLVSIGEDD